MPQPFNNAIMTNGGARLLTKAQAGEIKIEFTRVEVGNGNYTEDEKTLEALQSQTALKSMKNSYPISDIEVYNDYSVKVTALISNQDSVTGDALITAGYYINEMGLYAKEKDGTNDTEVLYSIAVTAGSNGDFMPPYNGYNPAQIIQDYFATVNNSAKITIQTSGAVALAEDLFEVRKDIELLKRNGAANSYSTETEYHAGEYCIYNNTLYRCLKDTSGEWDPESWEMTNPMEEIGQLKKSIDSLIGLFGRDEEGNMKSLGEAAFAGISHNFLTEEDGMVAGADLLKLLKEQVDAQNSASNVKYVVLSDLLGATAHNKPWLEIRNQYEKLTGKPYVVGTVKAAGIYMFIGFFNSAAHSSVLIHTYGAILIHVWTSYGKWYYSTETHTANEF